MKGIITHVAVRPHSPARWMLPCILVIGACDAKQQSVGSALKDEPGSTSQVATTTVDIDLGTSSGGTSGGAPEPAQVDPDAHEPSDSIDDAICQPLYDNVSYTLHGRDDVDFFLLDIRLDHALPDGGTGYDGSLWFEVDINYVGVEPPVVTSSSYPLSITVYDADLQIVATGANGDQAAILSELEEGRYYAAIGFAEGVPEAVQAATYSLVLDGWGHACD